MISEHFKFYSLEGASTQTAAMLQRVFYPPHFEFVNHTHNFYEITVVVSGTGYHVSGDNRRKIKHGDVICISPSCLHHLMAADQSLVFFNLVCNPDFWDLLRPHAQILPGWAEDGGSALWRPSASDFHYLQERCEHLERQSELVDALSFAALITELTWRYRRSQRAEGQALPPLLRALTDFLAQSDDYDVRPHDLAQAMSCSREHLGRLAQRHLTMTLQELLAKRRLEYAASLLRRSTYSIGDIASASGHINIGHFYESFRAYYSCAPGVYRKQSRHAAV